MFTGIIEEVGTVISLEHSSDHTSAVLGISAPTLVEDCHRGDSIAVNGVCLTVTDFSTDSFSADVMNVTLDYTTLGSLQPGDEVNLERTMNMTRRFGGHIVQGHVDGTASVLSRTPGSDWEIFRFAPDDQELWKYIVKKGSIAINGTSLTISEVDSLDWFEVSLIPTTLSETMLSSLQVGDRGNIECDIVAKYVEKMVS